MPGEQEHHISSVPFFFSQTYKITTCERTIIHAQLPYELHHKICNLRYGTHGYGMGAYEGMAKINFNRMK